MQRNDTGNQPQEMQRQRYAVQAVALASGSVVPVARGGATLTQLDSGEVYLIGGANREAQSFGDVYRFDLAKREWKVVAPTEGSLPARSGHASTAIGPDIYVFGGLNPIECVVYEDIHIFHTASQTWTAPDTEGWVPSARNASAAIRLTTQDGHHRILFYGGSSPEEGAFDDVYILHVPIDEPEAPLRWERCECKGTDIPEARELHVASFLTPSTIIFSGGRNKDGNVCTDMALLTVETWEWQLIPICEWNRCSHAAGMVDGALVSFGGFDGGAIRSDTWVYSDDEESWLRVALTDADKAREPEVAAVSDRFGHCGCSVELPTTESGTKRTQGLLVFGGMNAECDLNDLVLITPAVNT